MIHQINNSVIDNFESRYRIQKKTIVMTFNQRKSFQS